MPWDQHTILGWSMEISYSIIISASYLLVVSAVITFFIAICEHHQAFHQQFKTIARKITKTQKADVKKNMKLSNESDIKSILCELIHFHISVKEWANFRYYSPLLCDIRQSYWIIWIHCSLFSDTSDVYSIFLLIQMAGYVIMSALSVVSFDLVNLVCLLLKYAYVLLYCCLRSNFFYTFQMIRTFDNSLFFMVTAFVIEILTLFIYCIYGQLATESFLNYGDCLYELDWINMPVELQKLLLNMIYNTQRPLCYHVFGITKLSLETFTKVSFEINVMIHHDFSYWNWMYWILKNLFFFYLKMLRMTLNYYMLLKTIAIKWKYLNILIDFNPMIEEASNSTGIRQF